MIRRWQSNNLQAGELVYCWEEAQDWAGPYEYVGVARYKPHVGEYQVKHVDGTVACWPSCMRATEHESQLSGKILIRKSETADTRTCDVTKVTKDQLLKSSEQHIQDVDDGIFFLISLLQMRRRHNNQFGKAPFHDHDKLSDIDQFFEDFTTEGSFIEKSGYKRHIKKNRHHLNTPEGIPEDVNLIDVLEYIVDCVMAGKARSGTVFPIKISNELIQRAVANQVEMMIEGVEVVE